MSRRPNTPSFEDQETEPVLVCEGECNPGRASLDALVLRLRAPGGAIWRGPKTGEKVARLTDDVTVALRRLRYTPHRHISRGDYACQSCSTVRQWGAR